MFSARWASRSLIMARSKTRHTTNIGSLAFWAQLLQLDDSSYFHLTHPVENWLSQVPRGKEGLQSLPQYQQTKIGLVMTLPIVTVSTFMSMKDLSFGNLATLLYTLHHVFRHFWAEDHKEKTGCVPQGSIIGLGRGRACGYCCACLPQLWLY